MDTKDIQHFWPEWSVVELIGEGSFGTVYKIERKKGNHFFYSALKVIRVPHTEDESRNLSAQGMDDRSIRRYFHDQVKALENEIVLMESVKSAANVVSIEDHYLESDRDRIGWTVYIRMELLESLNHYINLKGRLSRDEVIKLGIDISNALANCEKTGIIHRDINSCISGDGQRNELPLWYLDLLDSYKCTGIQRLPKDRGQWILE